MQGSGRTRFVWRWAGMVGVHGRVPKDKVEMPGRGQCLKALEAMLLGLDFPLWEVGP